MSEETKQQGNRIAQLVVEYAEAAPAQQGNRIAQLVVEFAEQVQPSPELLKEPADVY